MKKIVCLLLSIVLCLAVAPITAVLADTETTAYFKIGFEDNYNADGGKIFYKNAFGDWIEVTNNIDGQNMVQATALKVELKEGYFIAGHTSLMAKGTNVLGYVMNDLTSPQGYPLTPGETYEFEHFDFSDQKGNQFSGTVYFVWVNDNNIYTHKIENIVNEIGKVNTNYVPLSTIKDDANNTQYVMGQDYWFVWENQIGEVNKFKDAAALLDEFRNNEDFMRQVTVNPCGAVNGPSTICTNGDMNFRLTIYDDTKFEGISFNNNEDDYTYFPSFWDGVFFNSTVDLADSTIEQPAVYESFISEPKIHFEKAVNSLEDIGSVKALDAPEKAVVVTKNQDGSFDIEFKSNYYDHVTFEIITDNNVYYIMIVRTTMQITDNFGPDMNYNAALVCELYYDINESCEDYEVIATLHNEDGTTEVKKAVLHTEENGEKEFEGGKGLKKAYYDVEIGGSDLSKLTVVGADFNVVKKSADTNTFGGAYCGSDYGTYYDIESREVIY